MSRANLTGLAFILGATSALFGWSQPGHAEYPEHSITAIVPFSAGAAVDIVGRVFAAHLSEQMKVPVVVVDKPGADGAIGFDYVAKAKPDGYTILFSGGAETSLPALHSKLPYDPVKDVSPVAGLGDSTVLVGVSSKIGVSNLLDFVALAKKNPGKYNAAIVGTSTRLSIELFQLRTGTQFVQITYPGTAEASTAILSGEADVGITSGLGFKSIIGSDGVKLLASGGPSRSASFPTIPTTAEAGVPQFVNTSTYSLFVTGGTPAAIVERLNKEVNDALKLPDVAKALAPFGLELPKGDNSVAGYTKRYLGDLAMWKEVVRDAKIPPTD